MLDKLPPGNKKIKNEFNGQSSEDHQIGSFSLTRRLLGKGDPKLFLKVVGLFIVYGANGYENLLFREELWSKLLYCLFSEPIDHFLPLFGIKPSNTIHWELVRRTSPLTSPSWPCSPRSRRTSPACPGMPTVIWGVKLEGGEGRGWSVPGEGMSHYYHSSWLLIPLNLLQCFPWYPGWAISSLLISLPEPSSQN